MPLTTMSITGRELGPYERYSLCRTLVGHPPVISYIAVLASTPSESTIQASIAHLLVQYPLLKCHIADPHTAHPRYVHEPSLNAKDVFRGASSDASHADILKAELDAAREEFDVHKSPLWRVTLYTGMAAPRLALTLNHTLSDGIGGRNLLGQLLSLLPSPPASALPVDALPPTLESTVDVRPGYLHLLSTVFSELIAPRLPSFITSPKTPIWPNPTPIVPAKGRVCVLAVSIPSDWIPRLKSSGAAHGVKTLQPLLHTCALAALSAAVEDQEIRIATDTPISLRDAGVGHPRATGNYIGSHVSSYPALSPNIVFWDEARSYANAIRDPARQAEARGAIGMLAYAPNPEAKPGTEKSGRELWMEGRIGSTQSLGISIELSNLGLMEESVEGVREVIFVQTPGPAGSALTLNLISSRGGPLNITTSFREGICRREVVDRFQSKLMANAEALTKNAVGEEATFAHLSGLL